MLLVQLNRIKKNISRFVQLQYTSKAFEGKYLETWLLKGTGKSLKRLSLNTVLYRKMYWKSRQINWRFWIWYEIKILLNINHWSLCILSGLLSASFCSRIIKAVLEEQYLPPQPTKWGQFWETHSEQLCCYFSVYNSFRIHEEYMWLVLVCGHVWCLFS